MNEKVRIDLHMHTCISNDGEFTPSLLMKMCKEAELHMVAIADHNTVKAIPEAKQAAQALGLQFISAIELDCVIDDTQLHVLGYGVDEYNPAFTRLSEHLLKQDQLHSALRLEKAKELGLYIDEEYAYALSHEGVITGEIIAEVALQDKRNHGLLKEYLPHGKRSDNPYVNFYWDFCSQGKPAFVEIEYMSLTEAIAMIHDAGGFAILAHPGINTKENTALLDRIFKQDIVGIEVFSNYHTPQQIAFYKTYAKKHQLLITAGSDFHGKTKPTIHLGETGCKDTTAIYHDFMHYLQQHNGNRK